jgi:hypothetical protein
MRDCVSFQHTSMQAASKFLQNNDIGNVHDIWQAEAQHSKHKTTDSGRSHVTKLSFGHNQHIWPISTKLGVNLKITVNSPIPNLTRIRPLEATLNYADRWTDSHDESSRIFLCVNAPKDDVHKQSHGSWKHASCLHFFPHILYHHHVHDMHLLASQMLTNSDCPIHVLCDEGYVAHATYL